MPDSPPSAPDRNRPRFSVPNYLSLRDQFQAAPAKRWLLFRGCFGPYSGSYSGRSSSRYSGRYSIWLRDGRAGYYTVSEFRDWTPSRGHSSIQPAERRLKSGGDAAETG